jgi:hypothetical protein
MRKMLTKEVTSTTLSIAKMDLVDGQPQAVTLPEEVLLGNVSLEKAQKEMNKKFGQPITIFKLEANTQTYEMPVEEFIKVATIKVETPEQE